MKKWMTILLFYLKSFFKFLYVVSLIKCASAFVYVCENQSVFPKTLHSITCKNVCVYFLFNPIV